MTVRDGRGYSHWGPKILNRFANPIIDGRLVQGHLDAPLSSDSAATGNMLQMVGGSSLFQMKFAGSDRPIVSKRTFRVRFVLVYEEDAYVLREKASFGIPMRVLLALPETDWFFTRIAPTIQSHWKSSRRAAWGINGMTHVTHPPKAFIDNVEQTVISTSTPTGSPLAAGTVAIPTAQPTDKHWFYVQTPEASTLGQVLQVRFWPEYLMRFHNTSEVFEQAHHWTWEADAEEFLAWGDHFES